MGNPRLRKGRPNPYVRTGLSRSVLLQLEGGPATISSILGGMGPHSEGVHRGTILTILNRAILNGLVTTNRLDGAKKPYLFELTDGGRRRVRWIRGGKVKTKSRPSTGLRAVANPKGEEE
jgi:DNA-binding PadR family transcriptional regulator